MARVGPITGDGSCPSTTAADWRLLLLLLLAKAFDTQSSFGWLVITGNSVDATAFLFWLGATALKAAAGLVDCSTSSIKWRLHSSSSNDDNDDDVNLML
jgi:hypothetical protein